MAKPSQTMQLDHPRLLLTESSPARRWVFYVVLSALGGLGAWGCFISAFALPVSPAALTAAGLLCCGFTVWRQVDPRRRWWSASLAGWAVWLALSVFFFDQFLHGAQRSLNAMLDQYSDKLNYNLPTLALRYAPGVPRPHPEAECTVFFSLLFYPFFWCMSRLLARRGSTLGAFCLSGMLLVFPLSFSILPADWAFGALLLFWCALLLVTSVLGGRQGLLGRRERYRASGAAAAKPGTLLLLPLLLAGMAGVYLLSPPESYARPQLVDSLRSLVEEGLGSRSYMRGGQGSSNRWVQLNTLGSRAYTGETVLRVKFDWQGINDAAQYPYNYDVGEHLRRHPKEYLKSFVGSVYTGSSWERLKGEARQEQEQLALQAQNQTALYREQMYLDGVDAPVAYLLSVQNLGANPRCVFTPCGLADGEAQLARQGLEFVDDGCVKSTDFLAGTREYTLESCGAPTGTHYFSRVAECLLGSSAVQMGRADQGHERSQYDEYDQLLDGNNAWTGSLGVEDPRQWLVLRSSLDAQFQAGGEGWTEDLWKAPEALQDQLDLKDPDFLDQMEAYHDFVYRYYTQVPESLREYLVSYRQALDLNPYTREERFDFRDGPVLFAYRIAQVFRQYYTYTLSPPAPQPGEDFVGFFLDQSQEGYCVHFASAAVLLLRSAGYPARYAEGYAVPCTQSGWIDVPDYNAHAWVEVYCGGTGWVPVEVTPASTDNPSVYYNAALPGGSEGEAIQIPSQEPAATLPPRDRRPLREDELGLSTPEPQQGASPAPDLSGPAAGGPGGQKEAGWLALGCCGLLLAAAGLLLSRSLRRRSRAKALARPDRNQAALSAYALLLELYQWEALCGLREEPPPRWKELAEKARFGRGMLEPEELRELTAYIAPLQKKLRMRLSRWHKLRCWAAGLI